MSFNNRPGYHALPTMFHTSYTTQSTLVLFENLHKIPFPRYSYLIGGNCTMHNIKNCNEVPQQLTKRTYPTKVEGAGTTYQSHSIYPTTKIG